MAYHKAGGTWLGEGFSPPPRPPADRRGQGGVTFSLFLFLSLYIYFFVVSSTRSVPRKAKRKQDRERKKGMIGGCKRTKRTVFGRHEHEEYLSLSHALTRSRRDEIPATTPVFLLPRHDHDHDHDHDDAARPILFFSFPFLSFPRQPPRRMASPGPPTDTSAPVPVPDAEGGNPNDSPGFKVNPHILFISRLFSSPSLLSLHPPPLPRSGSRHPPPPTTLPLS